ncbi:MAG TPA: PH domain-containing protein [Acidimicrobiales bacterium]|nr:PH domain-containing protein [Acidimicrobiales bacterium]
MDGSVATAGTRAGGDAGGQSPATPAGDRSPTGPGLRSLHPRQVQVWTVGWGLVALVFLAGTLLTEVLIALPGPPRLPWPVGAASGVLAAVAAALVWKLPRLAFGAWRYELTDSTLELRRGLVVRTHSAIPYFRVQHIDITRSPIERALGLSQLVVRTAAATTDARIPGIAAADAERLRDVVLARSGRGDAV